MISKYHVRLRRGIVPGVLLIPILLLTVACNWSSGKDFTNLELPATPVAAKLPAEVKMARDATLKYIDQTYDLELPMSDADWHVAYDNQGDIVGLGAYRLTAESCVLTISSPLLGLDSAVFHVILEDPAAGLHWEGDVDCLGHVLPAVPHSGNMVSFASATLNLVDVANLQETVGIEICGLDCASYTPLVTIANPEIIGALIDALQGDLPLRPRAKSPAVYQLRFLLADGQYFDFGYTCQMKTPTLLCGNQDFWQGQDAIAPDAFNELLLPLIAPDQMKTTSDA